MQLTKTPRLDEVNGRTTCLLSVDGQLGALCHALVLVSFSLSTFQASPIHRFRNVNTFNVNPINKPEHGIDICAGSNDGGGGAFSPGLFSLGCWQTVVGLLASKEAVRSVAGLGDRWRGVGGGSVVRLARCLTVVSHGWRI